MSKKTKELENRIKQLEERIDTLVKTTWAYKWLIDHPNGVTHNTTVDFIPTYGLSIDYLVNVDYFDNRHNKVVSFTPIRSHGDIEVKTTSFDRLNGDLEIVFVKGGGKNRTYYEYKKNMYQVCSRVQLRIDWNGTGDWKTLPIISSESSCVTIP